ncbi:Carbamoyl-phosphate synthase L chain, ATP binding domain [Saccharopolyspora antimicrobica]|uniref:Carbamoyl-phosphate synthase L chain, ATP binding domain n=1 Tax=Saccharopolyspora antimicrobica TaxID=455193 RepID=A0A1I5KTT0_9PSEU|nr:ATP-grasp domain-containing protein [Saccharopolyspora antimicrobica]RKT89131.1 carbamoyl-phosphate synthase L subunit-like protein [Saccharopolyspora antimicrobica]SFO88312.1 Carbamoyl-phosphate synthase L chain, ATP binding domain [Saccharopolyspora antimicrobica]
MGDRTKNIAVLGLDERNLMLLREIARSEPYRFHALLTKEELMLGDVSLARLLDEAQARLGSFEFPVDAIVGYWDFPVSSMVPVLCTRSGLPGPSLESVVKCEHKYWSRLEQRKVTDSHPGFGIIDLDDPHPPPGLSFPMWVKPVKSFCSDLAFKVKDPDELAEAATEIRRGACRVGEAFDFLLSMLELPPEIAKIGGLACLAEEEVGGVQVTAEGYCADAEPRVYGVVDSLCYPGSSSFLRYQYPSQLPADVQERIAAISRNVIRQIGLSSAAFNIEYFWDPDQDKLNILEINPRLSQSHAPLFKFVDGAPNHLCMVKLALGEEPFMPHRQGDFAVAAKWFLRTFADAVVRSVPSEEDVERLRSTFPEAIVDVVADRGHRLSDLHGQDSYSFELADLYLAAQDEGELIRKYRRCLEMLPFSLAEIHDSDCSRS